MKLIVSIFRIFIFSGFISVSFSCNSDLQETSTGSEIDKLMPCVESTEGWKKYLYIGHAYQWHTPGNRIDKRLELMNKSCYDQIWLGGDVCSETTKNPQTLNYIDSIFKLDSKSSYWSVGNHDIRNGNLDFISEKTKRPLFYADYNNGLCMLVINTNLDQMFKGDSIKFCEQAKAQSDLISNVLDTVKVSSHLILLSHHVIWKDVHERAWTYGNHIKDEWRFTCDTATTFGKFIYPRLLKIKKERSMEVICVAGDAGQGEKGQKKKYGYWMSTDSILFLASGINNSKKLNFMEFDTARMDLILVFNHNQKSRELLPKFLPLDSIICAEQGVSREELFRIIRN